MLITKRAKCLDFSHYYKSSIVMAGQLGQNLKTIGQVLWFCFLVAVKWRQGNEHLKLTDNQ